MLPVRKRVFEDVRRLGYEDVGAVVCVDTIFRVGKVFILVDRATGHVWGALRRGFARV